MVLTLGVGCYHHILAQGFSYDLHLQTWCIQSTLPSKSKNYAICGLHVCEKNKKL